MIVELNKASLVVIKGDANYRRLLDGLELPLTSFTKDIAYYFPISFAALRTPKLEIATDMTLIQIGMLCKRS